MSEQQQQQSHQVRALARKALSYQKRQWFTNICCISLCPLIMVAISAAFGSLIGSLIENSNPIEEVLYCSNQNAMTSLNVPILDLKDERIPKIDGGLISLATETLVKAVNYIIAPTGNLQFSAGGFGKQNPCVFWFGRDYPTSDLYEQPTNLTLPFFELDSTYTAEPLPGWFGLQAASDGNSNDTSNSLRFFQELQVRPWYLYSVTDQGFESILGTRPEQQPFTNPLEALPNGTSPDIPATDSNTFFDTFEQKLWVDLEATRQGFNISDYHRVPYYIPSGVTTTEQDNEAIGDRIRSGLQAIAKTDKRALLDRNPEPEVLTEYFARLNKILIDVPYGGTRFELMDVVGKRYKWTLQIGTDKRISSASSFPEAGKWRLIQQTQLDNAILKFSNVTSPLASSKITQGLRSFPELKSTKIEFSAGSLIGGILFPFGVSFLLPIFVVTLVKEKEDRIFVMMKMNGLKSFTYILSHYITFFVLTLVSSIIFLVIGFVSNLEMFTQTSPLVCLSSFWSGSWHRMLLYSFSVYSLTRVESHLLSCLYLYFAV